MGVPCPSLLTTIFFLRGCTPLGSRTNRPLDILCIESANQPPASRAHRSGDIAPLPERPDGTAPPPRPRPPICGSTSDSAQGLYLRRKEPRSELQARPQAHTESKRHLSTGPVTGKTSVLFFFFLRIFSSRQNVCSRCSSSRSVESLPSDLLACPSPPRVPSGVWCAQRPLAAPPRPFCSRHRPSGPWGPPHARVSSLGAPRPEDQQVMSEGVRTLGPSRRQHS